MIAGLAGGVASQLFQLLRENRAGPQGDKTAASSVLPTAGATGTTGAEPAASVSPAAAKAIADFKALMLDLQAAPGGDQGAGAAGSAAGKPGARHGHHAHGGNPAQAQASNAYATQPAASGAALTATA